MGYQSCLADPDIWMRAAVCEDNMKYYEYLAIYVIYVDDTLCISHEPLKTMEAISKIYHIKDDKIEPLKTYLGAQIVQYRSPDDKDKIRWGMSSQNYINNAIKTVGGNLSKTGCNLSSSVKTPVSSGYHTFTWSGASELLPKFNWNIEMGHRIRLNRHSPTLVDVIYFPF
jgi:hypothetical protein